MSDLKLLKSAMLVATDKIIEASAELARLRAALALCHTALEKAEWGGRATMDERCPWCGHFSRIGHDAGCRLKAALDAAEKTHG